MKFTMTTPCKECPFRRSMHYLRPERAREIAENTAIHNRTFTCHKQITGRTVGGNYYPGSNDIHCAGALIMSKKLGHPNNMHRVAQRLGLYNPRKLDMSVDVYLSPDEMAEGHDG